MPCSFTTGATTCGFYSQGSRAFFLERASLSSIPFIVDDPTPEASRGSELGQLIVESYNGGKTSNLRKGSSKPISSPLITTNYDLRNERR